jgi:hypothetical protein
MEKLYKLECGGSLGWCAGQGHRFSLLFFLHLRDLVVPSLPYRQEISSLRFRSECPRKRARALHLRFIYLPYLFILYLFFYCWRTTPSPSLSLSLWTEAVLGHVFSYCQARPGTPLPPNSPSPSLWAQTCCKNNLVTFFLSLVFKFI